MVSGLTFSPLIHFEFNFVYGVKRWSALGVPGWLSQLSIQLLIEAQVMISQFVESSPVLGSALAEWSLLGILSPSLSALPPLMPFLSQNK